MSDEYIKRVEAEEAIEEYCCRMCADYNQYEGGCVSHAQHCQHLSGEEILKPVKSADVQPVSETENMATISDEFICKKCGIYLKDYIKVVMDEDNDGYIDEQHYEYEPKFCPECGAKVKEGDAE